MVEDRDNKQTPGRQGKLNIGIASLIFSIFAVPFGAYITFVVHYTYDREKEEETVIRSLKDIQLDLKLGYEAVAFEDEEIPLYDRDECGKFMTKLVDGQYSFFNITHLICNNCFKAFDKKAFSVDHLDQDLYRRINDFYARIHFLGKIFDNIEKAVGDYQQIHDRLFESKLIFNNTNTEIIIFWGEQLKNRANAVCKTIEEIEPYKEIRHEISNLINSLDAEIECRERNLKRERNKIFPLRLDWGFKNKFKDYNR